MSTSTAKAKPRAAKTPEPASLAAIPLGLPAIVALFGRPWKKVRFPDQETARRGFRVLYRSGRGVDISGDFVFGLSAPEQLELLKKDKIPFEVVS